MGIKQIFNKVIRRHIEDNELQPCPFCGEQPNCFQVPDPRYGEAAQSWVIECKQMGCIFKRTSPNQSLDALIRQWNTRAGFWL